MTVFQVPASKAGYKQNRFEFTMPGSKKVHSIPKLSFLKPELLLKMETLSQAQAMNELFAEYLPEVLGQFGEIFQLEALFNAWSEASEMSLGESEASTAS
ncbi:hypothetical protein [Psychromicrobium lacuslunae]|uniref:Uncharacterized protein n=1 Tax=Psychromicrobium lacuslunae TaxID=1618207 RepID=A0A0D4C1X9_9MICC|nr:hypothetical protein [Psychromicrobium lacuslunae]AJT42420.1 hypothetical protein UM93_14610 [Psychromicrobium lacuslunae]